MTHTETKNEICFHSTNDGDDDLSGQIKAESGGASRSSVETLNRPFSQPRCTHLSGPDLTETRITRARTETDSPLHSSAQHNTNTVVETLLLVSRIEFRSQVKPVLVHAGIILTAHSRPGYAHFDCMMSNFSRLPHILALNSRRSRAQQVL